MITHPLISDRLAHHDRSLLQIRDACGVPFNWSRFCEIVGLRVEVGVVYRGGQGRYHPASRTIFIDERLSATRMRAVAAHEIGHWVLHQDPKDESRFRERSLLGGQGNMLGDRIEQEREADRIASCLAISPHAIADSAFHTDGTTLGVVASIKQRCEVPWEMAIQRVLHLAEDDQAIVEIAPCYGGNPRSLPMVLGGWRQLGAADVLALSIALADIDLSFETFTLQAMCDACELTSSRYQIQTPSILDYQRVSSCRALALIGGKLN